MSGCRLSYPGGTLAEGNNTVRPHWDVSEAGYFDEGGWLHTGDNGANRIVVPCGVKYIAVSAGGHCQGSSAAPHSYPRFEGSIKVGDESNWKLIDSAMQSIFSLEVGLQISAAVFPVSEGENIYLELGSFNWVSSTFGDWHLEIVKVG